MPSMLAEISGAEWIILIPILAAALVNIIATLKGNKEGKVERAEAKQQMNVIEKQGNGQLGIALQNAAVANAAVAGLTGDPEQKRLATLSRVQLEHHLATQAAINPTKPPVPPESSPAVSPSPLSAQPPSPPDGQDFSRR